jgi:hypothetical protein
MTLMCICIALDFLMNSAFQISDLGVDCFEFRVRWEWWLAKELLVKRLLLFIKTESALLYVALLFSIIAQISIRSRQLHYKIIPSTRIAAVMVLCQTSLLISAHQVFISKNPSITYYEYGVGNCACLTGATFGCIAFILLMVDVLMPPEACRRQTDQHRQFVYANILFIWFVVLGAVSFHEEVQGLYGGTCLVLYELCYIFLV